MSDKPSRSASPDPDGDADARPAKRRRARPQLSCTECRRLKMKCDREFPCLNCRRRDRAASCRRGGPTATVPLSEAVQAHAAEQKAQSTTWDSSDVGQTFPIQQPLPSVPLPTPPLPVPLPVQQQQQQQQPTHTFLNPSPTTLGADGVTREDAVPDGDSEDVGTLVMFPSGRSKFLGRTAASEWLQNHEVNASDSPPPDSRVPSPGPEASEGWLSANTSPNDVKTAFPFCVTTKSLSTAALLAQLPPLNDARMLVNVYWRHFAWHYIIVTEGELWNIFDRTYGLGEYRGKPAVHADQLALLYVVFAMAAYFNPELQPDDSIVEGYLRLSQTCLAKADFITKHTLAGVQTLHIMASLQLGLDMGRDGDNAWPLFGIMMRITQAMGLHRDGKRFGLSEDAAEERRRVFWECYSLDLIFSNKYSRPGSLSPDYIDTALPARLLDDPDADPFHLIKYDLASLSWAVMDHAMQVHTPPYSRVEEISKQISEYERSIPYNIRCRPHLCCLPSQYSDPEEAVLASPPVDKRNLQKNFQIFTMAIKFTECLIDLHRPYFWRALSECPSDPTRSQFAPSFLTIVERCNDTVVIASNLYELFPQPAARNWWIWYHAFNAAMCMATLCIKSPLNPLVPCARSVVNSVIDMYTSVIQKRNSPKMVKNLGFLRSLRAQVDAKVAKTMAEGVPEETAGEPDDLQFLGWRTRLVERMGQGLQVPNVKVEQAVLSDIPLYTAPVVPQQEVPQPAQHTPEINFMDDSWLEQLWGSMTSDGQVELEGSNRWSQELAALFPY